MNYITVSRPRIRLLKLLKHFFHNVEQWWELLGKDGESLGLIDWNQKQKQLLPISRGALGNWTDEELEILLDHLEKSENRELRNDLLDIYEEWYRSIVEKGIKDALNHSKYVGTFLGQSEYTFHFKSLTMERGRLVVSDCFVAKNDLVVFLRSDLKTATNKEFPKRLRTAFCTKKGGWKRNRIFQVQFFRERSYHLAKQHNLEHI